MSLSSELIPFDGLRIARRLWARRRTIALVHAAVLGLAVIVVLLVPRRYTSSVTLVPAPQDGLSLDLTGIGAASLGGSLSLTGGPTPQDHLRLVLASRAVADTLLSRFALERRWNIDRREDARERLAQVTTISTPREGQVEVAVEAETPLRAHDLAEAYAHVAAEEAVRLKASLAAQKRVFLQRRLTQVEADLAAAADRVRHFEEQNGAVALPDQTHETVDAAARLESELALAEADVAGARLYFTDRAPEVVTAQARVNALKRQLSRLSGGATTLGVATARMPALKQQAVALLREQASLTAVAELLRRLYEQSRIEEANPVAVFSVLDAADLPQRASFPRRGLIVAMVFVLTAAGSIAWAAFAEARDARRLPARVLPLAADTPAGDETREAA
ncbi:MAG: Wzz/FepE/Etk N-terminal domain-containing protein [Candidatus Eisenbacteria bacterium]